MEKGGFNRFNTLEFHKIRGGDCLSKTQDFAKFNNDVQSLTPARLLMVKDYKFGLLV
jgi:hypothetical protein